MRGDLIQFVPLANVAALADENDWQNWKSESDDPQFLLQRSNGQTTWDAGWYHLQIELYGEAGDIVLPCLYPDYGEGLAEGGLIPLWYKKDKKCIDCIIVLVKPTGFLRFDPTLRQAPFALGKGAVKRLQRFEAYAAMVKSLCYDVPEPERVTMAAIAREIFANVFKHSLSHAVDQLKKHYQNAFMGFSADYQSWVKEYDSFDLDGKSLLKQRAANLGIWPLVSVLMPVYNTPEKWLRRAIDSVVAQVYQNWELCIADDASTKPHVRKVLQEYAQRDARIRVVYRETNGHISDASNSALALAKGDFCALLDHDDELSPNALLEMVSAIEKNPDWEMIYSDEDKIDEEGVRYDPYFKSDWNYDLFLGQNFSTHLAVYKTALLRQIGGFRRGFEGSQDWDLALRVVEQLRQDQIGHVPKILYHWRAIEGSTAVSVSEKSYAVDAGQRAVQEHLLRQGIQADVSREKGGYMRIRYALPENPPMVSLVIPTRDRVDLLRMSVSSILDKTSYPDFEIIIMDNQSQEPETLAYFESLASEPRVRVIAYDAPFNYSAINNFGVAQARGDLIGLINNDIEVISPDWLSEMASHALRDGVGAVGAMLYYPDDTIQHAGVLTGLGGVAGHVYCREPRGTNGYFARARLTQAISVVTAACLLVRRDILMQVQGLDERLAVAFNDVDLCLRIQQAGYRNVWTPFAELYHHESATRGYEDTPEKQARFRTEVEFMQARHGDLLSQDPFYNPNLSLQNPFALAFPPRTLSN